MERRNLYERFSRYEWPQQVGNLASTLARVSLLSTKLDYDKTLKDLLREATLLIEWCAPGGSPDLQKDLSFMQRELLVWRNISLESETRKLLSLRSRIMSDQLLEASGLL